MFFLRLGFYSFFDPLKAREGTPGRFHFLTNGTVRRGGALKGEKNAPFCLVLSILFTDPISPSVVRVKAYCEFEISAECRKILLFVPH